MRIRRYSPVAIPWLLEHGHVSSFGMHETLHGSSVDDQTHTDPRAERHVRARSLAWSGEMSELLEGWRIHVRVKGHRHVPKSLQRPHHVRLLPACLRRGGDESPGGRVLVQVDGAEASDTESVVRPRCEPLRDWDEGVRWRTGRGEFGAFHDLQRLTSGNGSDEGCATSLHGGESRHQDLWTASVQQVRENAKKFDFLNP
mmetsp:Transcript_27827/g.73513  ORF Transcript_27827/g.73513 Transcript_27827/m.73513 type:complete len:200 (-) Transcript_27827:8-607(-)